MNADTVESIKKCLLHVIIDKSDLDALEENTLLEGDLGMNSLDLVEFVMNLEEEYGIEIPDEEAENFETIGKVATYLDEHEA